MHASSPRRKQSGLFRTLPSLPALLAGLVLAGGATALSAAEAAVPAVTPAPVATALAAPEPVSPGTTALEWMQAARIGWNLGNQFDSQNNGRASETAWGNPRVTPEVFRTLAAEGFGIVRMPVTWLGHIGTAATGYKVEEAWLARVAEVAGYAHGAGLKVVINIHHDGADSAHWLSIRDAAGDDDAEARIANQLSCVWTQIATYFRNHGDWLMFEGMNEIHDGGWGWGANRKDGGTQYGILNGWNQVFVDAVRATGGNNATRILGVCGYVTDPELTANFLQLPDDSAENRLAVSVHFYAPTDYAIEAKVPHWGRAGTRKSSWGQEDHVRTVFDRLQTAFVAKGTAVYVGEYGAARQKGFEDFRRYYMEYVTKAIHDRGMVPFYWDNNSSKSGKEAFGLFQRPGGQLQSDARPLIDAMIRAVSKDYALKDIVLPKP